MGVVVVGVVGVVAREPVVEAPPVGVAFAAGRVALVLLSELLAFVDFVDAELSSSSSPLVRLSVPRLKDAAGGALHPIA
jgi:hypothetical protein